MSTDAILSCGCVMGDRRVCVKHCGGHGIPAPAPIEPQEVARLRAAVDRDQTGLAAALNKVRKIAQGWAWLGEPDAWGSYESDDRTEATLRLEAAALVDEVTRFSEQALAASGEIANRVLARGDTLPVDPFNAPATTLQQLRDLLDELWRVSRHSGRLTLYRDRVALGEHVFQVEVGHPRGLNAAGADADLAVAIRRAWRLYVCGFTLEQLQAEELERGEGGH